MKKIICVIGLWMLTLCLAACQMSTLSMTEPEIPWTTSPDKSSEAIASEPTDPVPPPTETEAVKKMAIVMQPKAATGAVGDSVQFYFEIVGGKEPYTYSWYMVSFNDKTSVLNECSEFTGVNTDTLRVNVAEAYDGVLFFCTVRDAYGNKIDSNKVKLHVE